MGLPVKQLADLDWMRPWARSARSIFLPEFCRVCGLRLHTEENGFYCPGCWATALRIEPPFCSFCGRPHESMVGYGSPMNFPCSQCRTAPLPKVDRIVGAMIYAGVIEDAIKRYKFHGKTRLAAPLAACLLDSFEYWDPGPVDLVVPVPLHRVRARSRGFNQSALLAKAIMAGLPQAEYSEVLARIRPTRTQSRTRSADRRENMRNAFGIQGEVAGMHVLLVDDVVTTGGTVVECASVLKGAGAARVDVLAVALAVSPVRSRVI